MPLTQKKFIVYKSSAGSGKTFTLVREYLKIVLQDPDAYRQVLAITFTNKAANEMKERIIRNLMSMADPGNYPDTATALYMLPQLADYLKLNEKQVRERAGEVLKRIIHHYAEFAISTIDSFTYRVIRTFARDLKIPMNFEVELDADALLAEAVDLLISEVGNQEQLTKILVEFVEKKAGDELSWQIEKDLYDFGKNLLAEGSIEAVGHLRDYDPAIFIQVKHNLLRWKSEFESGIRQPASEAFRLILAGNLTGEDFIRKEQGIFSWIRNMANGKMDKLKPNGYAMTALRTGEWINPKASGARKAAFEQIAGKIEAINSRLFEKLEEDLSKYILCRLLLNNLFATSLLSELEKMLAALCADNNKVLISEFNRRISGVVRDQPAPFIYERLGEKYQHYMIDEFQDTSVMQWHNLLPLIENSLSSNRMNLVVGDAKQAIYRWRSGDVEQFENLPLLIRKGDDPVLETREAALIRQYQEENLDRNHRSSPVIVDFNNRLFTFIGGMMPEGQGKAYLHAVQESAKPGRPGLVRIECINTGADEDLSYEELTHQKLLSVIHEVTEDNYRLSDIAILCRKNAPASRIAAYLIRSGIPVISSESLLLTQSEKVNFLIAWIRHLNDPADSIPMAGILTFLLAGDLIPAGSREEVFNRGRQPLAERFQELLTASFPFLEFKHLRRLELFGLIQFLAIHFKLDEQGDGYMQFFRDAILNFTATRNGSLADFLEWWEEKSGKLSVIIPEGIDAVRIMTIHKAKGLQFPVVIYPFADEVLSATKDDLWVDLEEEFARPLRVASLPVRKVLLETAYAGLYQDEMDRSFVDLVNVFYVAMTRPEERLYVLTGSLSADPDGNPSIPKLLGGFLGAEGKLQQGVDRYQFGDRWQKEKKKEAESHAPVIEPSQGRPGLKMLLRQHAPEAWDMEEPARNREWGNLIHFVLSKITNRSSIDEILDEITSAGLLSSQQREVLPDLIRQLITNPAVAPFFEPGFDVRNEPEILTAGGRFYRPDRVLVKEGNAVVIDFKTGKQKPDHRSQVTEYACLLSEIGLTVDEAWLLYVNQPPEIVRVI